MTSLWGSCHTGANTLRSLVASGIEGNVSAPVVIDSAGNYTASNCLLNSGRVSRVVI